MQHRIEVSTYLSQIAAPSALNTYQSHQSTILAFQSWLINQHHNPPLLTAQDVATYATHQLKSGYEPDTIAGQACTLANLLAVTNKTDPRHEQARIAIELPSESKPATQVRTKLAGTLINDESPNRASQPEIEAYLDYLRRSAYGTRTHVYAGLLYCTGSNPTPIKQLNRDDISIENKTVTLSLPETHLPVSTSIHTTRTAEIPVKLAESIRTYIQHERETPVEHQDEPLLTTHLGRASSSTLRRSVKRTSSNLSMSPINSDQPATASEQNTESNTAILPVDIQWAGLSNKLNKQ